MYKKKIYITSAVLSLLAVSACKDDLPYDGPIASQGDEVEFSFVGTPQSRTMYQKDWEVNSTQEIYWGDYIEYGKAEPIRIICPQASRPIGTYNVTPQGTADSPQNVSETIVKVGEAGVQWGNSQETHNFFAFYPADNVIGDPVKETLDGKAGTWVEAELEYSQSPVKYVGYQGQTPDFSKDPSFSSLAYALEGDGKTAFETAGASNRVIWYGQPDMRSAIMVANTPVGVDGYGRPVPLNFKVIADVLDLTINGPVTPNELNGTEAEQKAKTYINIQTVTIKHKQNKSITGRFKINIEDNTCVPVGTQSSILLTTAGRRQGSTSSAPLYPVLRVRENTTTPTANDIDQLRLRAFLIPGQISNLNELEITVQTDCGDYTMDLGDSQNGAQWVTGQIHKVKLPHFFYKGLEFDFTNWMAQLDPNIYVTELSIPGTWHTSVEEYQGTGNNDYTTQYKAGVRAFEVHVQGDFGIDYTITNGYTYRWSTDATVTQKSMVQLKDASGNPTTDQYRFQVVQTSTNRAFLNPFPNITINNVWYRLQNINTMGNVADGIKDIYSNINDNAFALIELGCHHTASDTFGSVPVVGSTYSGQITRSQMVVMSVAHNAAKPTDAQVRNAVNENNWRYYPASMGSVSNTESLTRGQIFVRAVEAALKEACNDGIERVYQGPITASTTIGDVKKHIIIKVNTNGAANGISDSGVSLWTDGTPALFSRWVSGSESKPQVVNLKWGNAIVPEPLVADVADAEGNYPLRWCYTEQDAIGSLTDRQKALDQMGDFIVSNYQGKHRTWYEIAIGGYTGSYPPTAAACQSVAASLNPYLLNMMTRPDRRMIPFGIVLMNYALDEAYSGPQLIRTIINNNNAFRLNRRPTATPSADSKTNASYASETRPPLKP